MVTKKRMTTETFRVLAAMAADPMADHYGLELAGAAGLPRGSIYPMLARLEREGLLVGKWEEIDEAEAGRRRRRYYTLTGEGASVAMREHEALVSTMRKLELASPQLRRLLRGTKGLPA